MKRTSIIILAVILLFVFMTVPETYAQRGKSLSVRVGYLNPKDAKSGFSIGGSLSGVVDEAVQIGLGFDFFRKTYTKTSHVATQDYASGINEETIQKEVEYTTTILPIMAELLVKIPGGWSHSYFIRGGLGYELLWNKESNYVDDKSESRFYSGFAWQVGVGIMYKLGRVSSLFAEGIYNSAEVSRGESETPAGLPVWQEVDLSGFGVRVGVNMGLW